MKTVPMPASYLERLQVLSAEYAERSLAALDAIADGRMGQAPAPDRPIIIQALLPDVVGPDGKDGGPWRDDELIGIVGKTIQGGKEPSK